MKNLGFYGKASFSLVISTIFFSGIQQAQATLLDPAQSPLILSESVAPNLILTLDDSGSMVWAFVPDNINSIGATRRAKSAAYNPMYYNPAVTYLIPVKTNADGTRASTQYSTSFSKAYHNGFDTDNGNFNLGDGYKVSWAYNPSESIPTQYGYSNTTGRLAQNPTADFGAATISTDITPGLAITTPFLASFTSSMGNGQSASNTSGGITYSTTRTGSTTCTARISSGSSTSITTNTETDVPSSGYTTTTAISNFISYPNAVTCSRTGNIYTVTSSIINTPTITKTVTRKNLTQVAVPAYYYLYDENLASCSGVNIDENCYKLVNVTSTSGLLREDDDSNAGKDERENFARWYSFYRNRALATLSAANLAFNGLPRSVRLTWQTLGNCKTLNSANCGTNYFRKFSDQHRGNFFNWLPTVSFNQTTYLLEAMQRAGSFLQETNSDAWAANPKPLTSTGGTGTTVQEPRYACRPSYQIMMTDGMWNSTPGMPSPLKSDEKTLTLPDGTAYSKQRPFTDAQANTLADLAFHYWATDASTLANDIKPIIVAPNTADSAAQYWDPRNDPATWQHMVNYTIGLGIGSSLTVDGIPWTGNTFGGSGYDALKSGAKNWPPASNNSQNNVYDLWHTAINSRGEFFSADSPDKVVDAFRNIIDRISNRTTSAGAPGVTASIVEDTLNREVYETQLNSEDWSGNLTKYSVAANGIRSIAWSAKTKIASQNFSSRNIKMFGGSGVTKLKDFTWTNLSTDQQKLLNIDNDITNTPTDSKGASRLSYIRGDQTNEGNVSGKFRERSSVLGDIINSSPVIVGTPKYLAYLVDSIDGGTDAQGNSKYAAFKTANRAEKNSVEVASPRRPMVYVGANDGMLHGFDANTGEEKFAFVPSAVIKNLYKLPAQKYKGTGHQYYVDGTPVVADVYYDSAWHTVLIGTMRAGGRSIFALDITNPDNIKLLWERSFDDNTPAADLANLGYTFPQPVIARLHTGKWAVVTGNGYGNQLSSAADKASLMIFDIEKGTLEREIVVPGDATKANGLSSVKLADNNSDGIADYAYAGDLQGNMWRFDLVTTSSSPAQPDPFNKNVVGTINASRFAVSYGNTALFTTKDARVTGASAQPITAPPSLVRHPSGLGYLVVFGTGKYFEREDGTIDTTRSMSLYGIWDRKTKAETTTVQAALTRTSLQAQTITEEPSSNPFGSNASVLGIRLLSQNAVEWYKPSATTRTDIDVSKWGWLLDFKVDGRNTFSGEMLINPMATRGQVLLLNTLTPNADPCKDGVDSWLYGVDPYTGGRTNFNVFDLDNSKTIDGSDSVSRNGQDVVVSSYKKPGSGGFTTNNGEIYTAPSQGGGMMYSPGPNTKGRQSWRIIPQEAQ